MPGYRRRLRDLALLTLTRLRPSEWQWTLAIAALIGVLGALATVGFREGLVGTEHLLFGRRDGETHIAAGLVWWMRLAVPTVGGVLAGLILAGARRAAQGEGGDYMEAIALGDGDLPVRVSVLRALSSAATVVSGGAIGREGPMVQLAALTGSLIGRWRRAPVPRRRLWVACGAAAGVATAYGAPIAGALFVAELVLHSLAIESLGPLLVAAVAANLASSALVGFAPVYEMPAFTLPHGSQVLLLAGLGVVAGLGAPLYLGFLEQARKLFGRWHAPAWLKLGSGGLLLGAISVADPNVWGNGYAVVDSILHGGWLWQALVLVLLLKLLAVGATAGSGAVGGVFTPTLFMGAAAGALCNLAIQALWPGVVPPTAAVAVGMGAFLAACTHAPLMSVLMIFEMTENYGIVVPLMLACVLGFFIARALHAKSIYATAELSRPTPSLTMAADFIRRDSAAVVQGSSVRELEAAFLRFRRQHVYVLDADGRFEGAVALYDLASLITHSRSDDQPWPDSLTRRDYPRVRDTAPVWEVLETFAQHPGERLPVLDAERRLLGYVTKSDLVMMFSERLAVG